MAPTVLTKSTEQQLTNREIQNTGSFKIEANFHLIIFIIKGNEIYLLYTFKKDIDSLPVKCDYGIQKQLHPERSSGKNLFLKVALV